MSSFPTGVRVFIDDVDATVWLFGSDTIDPTDLVHEWKNIDITSFIKGSGQHVLKVTADGGVGRVEARLEII